MKRQPKNRFPSFQDDWRETTLGDVGTLKAGISFKEKYQGKKEGPYPFIKVSDMNLPLNNKYIKESNNWINEDVFKELRSIPFPSNSIVFAKLGAAILLNRKRILIQETFIDNNMMGLIMNKPINIDFIYYLLLNLDFKVFINEGAVPSLNSNSLKSFLLSLPSLAEQERITHFLNNLEEQTNTLKEQVKHLKKYKKQVSKNLFNQTLRFDFQDDWRESTLGDVGEISKGKTAKKKNNELNLYPIIAGGKSFTDFNEDYNYENVITVSASGANAGYITLWNKKIWASDCSVIENNKNIIDLEFLFYLLKSKQEGIYFLQTGGAQPHVYPKDLNPFPLTLPSLAEQERIAHFLNNLDEQISTLEEKITYQETYQKQMLKDLFV